MKRIETFVLLILCLSLQVSAQVKIGVDAGMNLTHFKSHYSREAQKVGGMGAGFQIGGTVDYEFKRHWMLMSGVSFMQTQVTWKCHIVCFPNFRILKLNSTILSSR